jgi:hypothetical protein
MKKIIKQIIYVSNYKAVKLMGRSLLQQSYVEIIMILSTKWDLIHSLTTLKNHFGPRFRFHCHKLGMMFS